MSKDNVELVRRVMGGPVVDMATMFRDEATTSALDRAASPYFHADFECAMVAPGGRTTYVGFEGLREAWLEWLTPWESHRVEIEELRDLGDRVLALVRQYGRLRDTSHEVEQESAAVWSWREGKVARIEFYANRAEAIEAVGSERGK